MFDLLDEAIQQKIETALSNINTSLPGTIISIDHAKNRAVVRPDLPKAIAVGDPLDPPNIVEVPIVWPASGGGNASMTFPLKPGDGVLLQFQQRSIENWLDGKKVQPDDPRQFDLSDCVAIAGAAPGGTVGHSDNVVLKFGGSQVNLQPDGTIFMGNGNGSITITGDGTMILKANTIHVDTPAKAFTLELHKHERVQAGGAISGGPVP